MAAAYELLHGKFTGVSDEHCFELLCESLTDR